MIIEPTALVSKFYQQCGEEYAGISLDEMKNICTAQFDMLRQVMGEPEFEEVRLQYLFVARVSAAKVIKGLESLVSNRNKGTISKKDYDKYWEMFSRFVEKNPVRFEKYKERLKNIGL